VTFFRSVGGRLAFALVAVVAAALGIVYVIVVPSYQRSLENQALRSLTSSLEKVALPGFPQVVEMRTQYVNEVAAATDARVVVFVPVSDGGPLEPSEDSGLDERSAALERDPTALRAYRRGRVSRGVVEREGQHYAEVAAPQGDAVVLLSAPLHAQLQTVQVVRRRLLIAGGISTLFALLAGYGGARVFARRLRRLEAAAERLAAGQFDEPVVDAHEDEVGQLARAFERMRLRLATLDRARGEFIANASHELRTPLFSLAGFLELLDEPDLDDATRAEFRAQMRDQVERLTKLATDLLDLSRLDAGRLATVNEPVDLAALAGELAAEFAARAATTGDEIEAEEAGPVEARGDAERILQIGRVLVENALVHTPAGTRVRVSAVRDGHRATLAVADDGPGIPPEARGQVFERFFRLEGGRASGSGLGLAIARELAVAMDGRIELSEEDGWTRFTLALPADVEATAKNVKTPQTAS
jgi:signal transduction histidine kinase